MDDMAVRIAEDLHLDMPAALDVFLHEKRAVPECSARLRRSRIERALDLAHIAHDSHAAPATTRPRFQHDWKTEARGFMRGLLATLEMLASRNRRNTMRFREANGSKLVAHRGDRIGARPDEVEPGLVAQ